MSQGKVYKFSGTQLQVVGSFGTAVAVTAITNASPAVVTQTGHGHSAATVVKFAAVGGMTEVNGMLCVIKPLTADTYQLVGVDSTNWGVYTTGGTAAPAVWVGSCESTQYSNSSGSTAVDESETNCGTVLAFGSPKKGTVSLGLNMADTAYQQALETSRLAVAETALRLAVPNYPAVLFDIGIVTSNDTTGSSGGKYTGTAALQRTQHQAVVRS